MKQQKWQKLSRNGSNRDGRNSAYGSNGNQQKKSNQSEQDLDQQLGLIAIRAK